MRSATDPLDVLVVGAGPTGLALAAQLELYGVRFRLVDRQPDRVHESRALASPGFHGFLRGRCGLQAGVGLPLAKPRGESDACGAGHG